MTLSPSGRHIVVGLLFLPIALAGGGMAWAEPGGDTATAWLQVAFRDSRTGAAVRPGSLLLDGQEAAERVDAAGRVDLAAAPGDHQLAVRAEGYQPLTAKATALDGAGPLNVILLDPIAPPPELAFEALQGRPDAGTAVLAGCVVDDALGTPVEGASIGDAAGTVLAFSDARGFFTLEVPLSDGVPLPEDHSGRLSGTRTLTISRPGYATQEWDNFTLITGGSRVIQIRLQTGGATQASRHIEVPGRLQAASGAAPVDAVEPADSVLNPSAEPLPAGPVPQPQSQSAPLTIRVGRNCPTKYTCSTVQTMNIDTYVKHVLPAEWFTSWVLDSHKAGAIAIRSYGGWHVYNPLTATYDICDTSSCQVYKDSTNPATDTAVDATINMYVVDGSGNIGRAEYSAENNDLINRDGCGNCYTLNNPSDGVCLYDDVCCGRTQNGHGRGMCQWGTQLWALNRAKTYDWMVQHYYQAYAWVQQNFPPILTQQPASQNACGGATVTFTVAAYGRGTLSYQWQKNALPQGDGGHYSGTTTATLTVGPVDASDAANYRCLITDLNGTSTSNNAILMVAAITQHPVAQNGCPGATFQFSVAASGSGLTWQWQKDGGNVSNGEHYSGATTATLTISTADAGDLGDYRCRVTATCGTMYSNAAALTLDGPAFARADFNQDGHVDQLDFGHFQSCLSGSAAQNELNCQDAKLDGSPNVDDADLTIFLGCTSGSGTAADTCCATP